MVVGVSRARASAVGAAANRLWAASKLTSSRVRIERMQATSCSKREVWPSSARANIAAFGSGLTARRIRVTTSAISNLRLRIGGGMGDAEGSDEESPATQWECEASKGSRGGTRTRDPGI